LLYQLSYLGGEPQSTESAWEFGGTTRGAR
jgi:hypothetical protein